MNSDLRVLRVKEAENLHMVGLFRNHCITKGP